MMKTLWKKTPAWLKAIILNLVILFPVVIAIQSLIGLNFQLHNEWPWSVPIAAILLYAFYKLNKKYAKFDLQKDVQISFRFNMKKSDNWLYLIAILLIVQSIGPLFSYVFNIDTTQQVAYIQSFKALNLFTAIPVLALLAFCAGLTEEIVYRGHIQNVLVRKYNKWLSFSLTGIIFAALHFLPLPLILPYIIISVIFSIVADRMKSTALVIWGHFLVDLTSFMLILFFPNFLHEPSGLNILITIGMLSIGIFFLFRQNYSSKKTSLAKAAN
ncbi:CPBP family intramembrane glutamic endopeptidase [Marivirga arenosa]|uniref:CPBP family intramembrane glutamic endopeptidase n=1 Tax=Marivirga arenosa TaxID=3059076 RepID=A0AA49JCE2_9BACT|nr:CPBP family intramembrane glutamic endopeptidase [Marivirga sp. BKB1-2]WKK79936.2 CPBP family intramembrane glutamic endopeptidase [Marivirga sp. BKB1-2]